MNNEYAGNSGEQMQYEQMQQDIIWTEEKKEEENFNFTTDLFSCSGDYTCIVAITIVCITIVAVAYLKTRRK